MKWWCGSPEERNTGHDHIELRRVCKSGSARVGYIARARAFAIPTSANRAPYPSWTALGVNWLAGFDFEIKVIARINRRISHRV